MHLYLHIRISSEKLHFAPPLVNVHGVDTYDLDNFSEAVVINTCIQAIERTSKLFVVIEAKENIGLGGIGKILNKIAQLKIPYQITYHGNHSMLNKMLTRFKEHVISPVDTMKIQEKCDLFFNHG